MRNYFLMILFVLAATPCFATFPTTGILDNFDRANESPLNNSGAWGGNIRSASNRRMRVVSNRCANSNTGGNDSDQSYSTQFAAGNHEVYTTYITSSTDVNRGLMLFVKISSAFPPAASGYWLEWEGDGELRIYRLDASTSTQLGATESLTAPTNNDVVGLEALNDTNGTLNVYLNGTVVATRTDTTYKGQAGYIGIGQAHDPARMDDFGGGVQVAALSLSTQDRLGRRTAIGLRR